MFTLPGNAPAENAEASALPVIPVQESAKVLHALLGVLYPGKGSEITDSHLAGDVLAVAERGQAREGVSVADMAECRARDILDLGGREAPAPGDADAHVYSPPRDGWHAENDIV